MKTLLVLCLAWPFSSALAEPSAVQEAPAGLPPQARLAGNVLVPVSAEVFRTLDRFADSNWKAVRRPELARVTPGSNQARTALRLGAVIAEGFIAVEARDGDGVRDLGKTALVLSRALGVESYMLAHGKSIIEHAEKEQWAAVREEWSSLDAAVRDAMRRIRSEQVAQLVSLGGWARGAEALAALTAQHYAPEKAALLRQPEMLATFARSLAAMNARLKADHAVTVIGEQTLPSLGSLVGASRETPVSEADAGAIQAALAQTVGLICPASPPAR